MRIAVAALTEKGVSLGRQIALELSEAGHQTEAYFPQTYAFVNQEEGLNYHFFSSPLREVMKNLFDVYEAIVCVMALGIVVRLTAPLLQGKLHDPAVVVMDEQGQNVISMLSGHWGGANALTREIALMTGSNPVITTATDVNGLPAIDVLARIWGLVPEPIEMIRKVNSDILKGGRVAIYTEIPLELPADKQLAVYDFNETFTKGTDGGSSESGAENTPADAAKVLVTSRIIGELSEEVLFLRPRNIVAGIGCRRGVLKEEILSALQQAFTVAGRSLCSLKALASVDIKEDEEGLLEAAEALKVPIQFFSREEIKEVMEARARELGFSETVQDKIGVGGVCEPAAVLKAGQKSKILLNKRIFGRVTIALAEEN